MNGDDADELRAGLRGRLRDLDLSLEVVAEGILGDDAEIDFVARDGDGRAVVVLVAGRGQDAAAFTAALAQREWVRRRLGDWRQLAPELRIRPEGPVRCILVSSEFGAATLGATPQLPEPGVELVRAHFVGAARGLVLERIDGGGARGSASPESHSPRADRAPGASLESAFRSGLTDADLGLNDAERRDLDS